MDELLDMSLYPAVPSIPIERELRPLRARNKEDFG